MLFEHKDIFRQEKSTSYKQVTVDDTIQQEPLIGQALSLKEDNWWTGVQVSGGVSLTELRRLTVCVCVLSCSAPWWKQKHTYKQINNKQKQTLTTSYLVN